MAKDSFILYKQHFKQLELLPMEERGQLLTGILCHVNGEQPPPTSTAVQMLLQFITEQIDRDSKHYKDVCEKRAAAGQKGAEFGKLGGRPKKLESYNEIIADSNLQTGVKNKVESTIQHFALNGLNLKNDHLRFIIDSVKGLGVEESIDHLRFFQNLNSKEFLRYYNSMISNN